MSRKLCNYDTQCLCVNNYRGEDYNMPDDCVDCEFCVLNPDNVDLKRDSEDPDKVSFEDHNYVEVVNEK